MSSVAPQVLIVSPISPPLAPPSYDRLQVLYDAVEAQGASLAVEWLAPATLAALTERLAQAAARPQVLVLHVALAVGQGLVLQAEEDKPSGAVVGFEQLGGLVAGAGKPLVLLLPRCGESLPDAHGFGPAQVAGHELASLGLSVLSMEEETPIQALGADLSVLFSELVGGSRLGEIWPNVAVAVAAAAGPGSAKGIVFQGNAIWHLKLAASSEQEGVSKIVPFPGRDLLPAWKRLATLPEPGGLPALYNGPFVGRQSERLRIESELRQASGGALWLHGYPGIGKTSLMVQMARWLVRTGRFQRVVYTSFCAGGEAEWARYDLGKQLIGPGFDNAAPSATSQVADALRQTPTLVIWDQLECLVPEGDWPLAGEAWAELAALAGAVTSSGASRLCLLSDTLGLPKEAGQLGASALTIALDGLTSQDGLELLAVRSAPADAEQLVARQQLVELLGGQPMALTLLVELLAQSGAPSVMQELCAMMPGLRSGDGRLRNQALDSAISFFLRSLPEQARLRLPRLGLLVGGALQPMALGIAGLDADAWADIAKRLVAANVVAMERLPGFRVPYVRLHPAFADNLERRVVAATRSEVTGEFFGRFLGISEWMQTEERPLDLVRAMAHNELGNFRRALQFMLATEQLSLAAGYVQRLTQFARLLGLTREAERLRQMLQQAVQRALPAEGPLKRPGVRYILSQVEQLVAAGRFSEAGPSVQPLVQRIMPDEGLSYQGEEAALDRAVALHLYSQCLRGAGRPDMMLGLLGQALALLGTIKEAPEARQRQLSVLEDQADLLVRAMQLGLARDTCQAALALATELNAPSAVGGLHMRLAAIAEGEGHSDEAREHLETALAIFESNDVKSRMVAVLAQLGTNARKGGALEEALGYYERALALAQEDDKPLAVAQMLLSMGQVCQQSGQREDAKHHYMRAIGLLHEHNVRPPLVGAEMALADIYMHEGNLADARAHAEAARSAAEDVNAEHVPWGVYALLQRIAEAEGNAKAARMWRERAQDAFAVAPESAGIRRHWAPLIQAVASSCRGASLGLETVEMVEKLEQAPQWQKLAETIWRLLGGERGEELYAEADYVDALVIKSVLQAIKHPPTEEDEAKTDS
jgi:tetratricopeptide (TPR) repeat protein